MSSVLVVDDGTLIFIYLNARFWPTISGVSYPHTQDLIVSTGGFSKAVRISKARPNIQRHQIPKAVRISKAFRKSAQGRQNSLKPSGVSECHESSQKPYNPSEVTNVARSPKVHHESPRPTGNSLRPSGVLTLTAAKSLLIQSMSWICY